MEKNFLFYRQILFQTIAWHYILILSKQSNQFKQQFVLNKVSKIFQLWETAVSNPSRATAKSTLTALTKSMNRSSSLTNIRLSTYECKQVRNGEDLYGIIKEKIQKKGWLRKLMDNLTSHRQSISEAALHNFRLMTQNKGTAYKVTGLIVVDYIISAVLRESGLEAAEKVTDYALILIRERDVNAHSQYEQSENKPRQSHESMRKSFSTHNKPKIPTPHTQTSLHNSQNIQSSKSSYTNKPLSSQDPCQTNSLMLRQIYNVKFSNIFYNMIQSLIAYQDGIYAIGVKSIIMYTRFHTVRNIQQEKIQDLLQVLLEHIQTGEQVNLSLKAYDMLVQKLKDSFLENQIKYFRAFLKIWQQAYKQLNDEETPSPQTHAQNRLLIQSIIHKMITSMIGSVGVNKIYQQIIAVYDHNKFQNMVHFEEMLISITKRDELKNQFFRGLFSFLLSYLAVCRGNGMGGNIKSVSSIKNINNSSLIVQKWPTINSAKSYQAFIKDYENILDFKTKKFAIQTLKRWTHSHQFIEINEIIKYNSSLLLKSFLFNIHQCFLNEIITNSSIKQPQQQAQQGFSSGSRNFAKFLATEFCENFCKRAEIQQRVSLVNQLLDQVKSIQIQDQQKLLYLEMVNSLIYQEWIQSTKIIQFCQVDSNYSKTINLQLLSLSNILTNKFTQKMFIKQIDQIAYLLFSVFELLSRVSLPYYELVSLLNASIKLCQMIQRPHGSLVVLAFTQRMVKAVSNEMDKENFFMCWDLILNCTNMLFASPRNYNRQSTKKVLNQIYIKTTLNEQLKSGVTKIPQTEFDQKVQKILLDAFGDLTDSQQQQNLIRIQLPKPEDFEPHQQHTHQKIYELASIAFRDMFSRGVSRAKGGFMHMYQEEVSFQSQTNGFARANSIISERDVGHQEKSIAQVMDMIHI